MDSDTIARRLFGGYLGAALVFALLVCTLKQ